MPPTPTVEDPPVTPRVAGRRQRRATGPATNARASRAPASWSAGSGRRQPSPQGRLRVLLSAVVVLGLLAVVGPWTLPGTEVSAGPRPVATADTILSRAAATEAAREGIQRLPGPGTPAGDSRFIDLTVGNSHRGYFLLPALGLPAGQPAALLVVLHQDVSSGREISLDLGLDGLRRHGVTLAYPNGVGGSWNAGACCGVAVRENIDDVGFVSAVFADVVRRTPIDPSRQALLGYSGGAMLTYRFLCREHPKLVAAVEINGSLESHCSATAELPDLLSVHGEKDGSVGLTEPRFVSHLGMAPRAVTSTLRLVTDQAACTPGKDRTTNGIDVWTWTGCRGGGSVQAQIVPGAGHGWADVGGAARATAFLMPRLTRR